LGLAFLFFLKEPQRGGAETSAKGRLPVSSTITGSVRAMFASPVLRQLLAASTLSGMVTYGILQWLPTYFRRVHELEQGQVGLVMALVLGVIGAIGTLIGGRLTDVLTRKRVDLGVKMIAIQQLVMIPLLIIGFMSGTLTAALAVLVVPFLMLSFFLGPSLALIQTYAPVEMRSLAAAIKMLCLNLVGLSLGPLIVGVISDVLEPSQGALSLAIGLSSIALFSIWSALHFWLAGRAMLEQERQAGATA
jgi:sugar phosphate permease